MNKLKGLVYYSQVTNLEKSISEMETELKNDQNNWLRLQGIILDMEQKLTHQMNDSHLARQRKTCFSDARIVADNYDVSKSNIFVKLQSCW